ncbi:S1C family serine protease [Thermomicrobium sp. 4228-Ro]|uniref:S1C family serine protease n=1 Tax=Thermomicrobium sp. 4228-Ro TaxID=2993937 RepID=UPI002248F864|nr:S1C family serine protease [Thermomicrobium sp. 4228-Ro]MCX2728293.1 S1C family serine protease [Thermomicrobium sp. 4228-Ro]
MASLPTLVLALVFLSAACRGMPFRNQPTPTPTVPQASDQPLAWPEVEERLRPATVLVQYLMGDGEPFATTGVAYAPGLILTSAPPIDERPPSGVQVRLPEGSDPQPAELLGASLCDGVAVVRVTPPERLALAPLAVDKVPDIGEDVIVYGFSAAAPEKPPVSLPAAATGAVPDRSRERDVVSVNVAVGDLAPGALMADRFGAVIGILLPTGSFLPAGAALEIAQSLAEGRGLLWLGLGLSEHRNPARFGTPSGLVVIEATSSGPAATAGIRPGMLLTRLDEQEVSRFAQVCALLRQHRQGDDLTAELRDPRPEGTVVLRTQVRVGEPSQSQPTVLRVEPRPARPVPTPQHERWTFDDAASADWPTGADERASRAISEGSYQYTLNRPQGWEIVWPSSVPPGTDQRIRALVRLPEESEAGLVVRFSQEDDGTASFYLCSVVRTGGQLLARCALALAGEGIDLVPATPLSAGVSASDPLELDLTVQDTHLTFRVAGQTVADLEDPLIGEGRVGLLAHRLDTTPVTIRFDEVEVEIVPASGETGAQATG